VAHAAANSAGSARAARAHADVLEADVHRFRGRLEVRHAKTIGPVPILWERWYLVRPQRPRPLLSEVLDAAAADPPQPLLLLDLKGSHPRLAPDVLQATEDWRAGAEIFVSARHWPTADRATGAPAVTVLHSVGNPRGLRRLLARYPQRSLDGVSIHRRLLDRDTVARLRKRATRVWTWPVDDPADARALIGWGVEGLISDSPERLADLRPAPQDGA
jgi:glycerophosphoryl diester phosphodiesterase